MNDTPPKKVYVRVEVIRDDENNEPTMVEWEGGLGNTWTVKVGPYAGTVRINGREFEVSSLTSDDVDDRLYRELNTRGSSSDAKE